ncbi:MAG: beta-ketoacyl-ACP synthase I [Planctomycetota bacterium]|nr:beta-ketoacyl-ACP synthase I [Planctomycetota bacterium]
MNRRVVITGIGIISPLGNHPAAVSESLKAGRSGIAFNEIYKAQGFRSQVCGKIQVDYEALIDRKVRRFMGDAAAYAYLAMQAAVQDSGLTAAEVSQPRTGIIVGTGGCSTSNLIEAHEIARTKGVNRIRPYMVPRSMGNSAAACLAVPFQIKGVNYSISSACATSAHCIGNAAELIQWGKQDVIFAGGAEEEHWTLSCLFDAMGALSSAYNETAPTRASRAYDANRDGFVIAGGGGVVVLEEYEHAKARGAKVYAEVVGYGATSDGDDMVAPSGEGGLRCMQQALATVQAPIDYINTHGTSTPAGDIVELQAIEAVFGGKVPPLSSTKPLSGHSLGAAGVHEAIYCLLMLQDDFIAASAHIETLDPGAAGFPIIRERKDHAGLRTAMSNSFGFGGTNATLVMQKLD